MGQKNFWSVKWAEKQFLASIYEKNNEIKYSVSTGAWNIEINFYLDVKLCIYSNKNININRFQTFENSFKLSLNMDLKFQYAIL